MRTMHAVNALAWFANAVCWTFYAQVPAMAVASLCACVVAVNLARRAS